MKETEQLMKMASGINEKKNVGINTYTTSRPQRNEHVYVNEWRKIKLTKDAIVNEIIVFM